jgi:isopropylmalate/homocitrate/citramalate synthase
MTLRRRSEPLFEKFKELADKRKEILDEDIEVLVAEEIRCRTDFSSTI